MKRIALKAKFLRLVITSAAASSALTACSTNPQTQAQAPTPSATRASSSQTMDHGGMHHGSMSEMDHNA